MTGIRPNSSRVHVWIPDYQSSHGGIQMFSQFFIRGLEDCLPDAQVEIFSKNDVSYPSLRRRPGRSVFHCAGWWPEPFRTLLYSSWITARALAQKPDLLVCAHLNFLPPALLLRQLAAVPYVAIAYGIEAWDIKTAARRHALRSARQLWAISQFTRERLAGQLGAAPQTVGLLPCCFSPESFMPQPKPPHLLRRYGLAPDQPVILTISRLAGQERYKGYDQTLHSLVELRLRLPRVRYLLGGQGQDRQRIERLARDLGVAEHLIMAGFIPDHELEDHYNLCDVFAMPSKGEGFGIVFLEALACGKPVLAGNKDGSVDAVLGGQLGALVDPDDVPAITRELDLILTRRHPLAILQQPAELRRRVIEAYGYPRFVELLGGLLRDMGFTPASVG